MTTATANPARLLVAGLVRDDQPGWNVLAEARPPEAIQQPTAVVWTGELARLDIGSGQLVQSHLDLWLFPAQGLKPAALEAAADEMLTAAVGLIEATEGLLWSTARRAVMDPTSYTGWHLTLTLNHQLTKE